MKEEKISKFQTGGRFKKSPEEYLENLKNFVKEKHNGELLSSEWGSYRKTFYKFKDIHGIEFERTAFEVMHNNLWTPDKRLMAEPITKQIFEYIFNCEFRKNNSILDRATTQKGNWELDGYNNELKIAFEYQGFSSHWNEKDIKFSETMERDLLKKELCKNLGIILIQIPTYSNYDLNNFRDEEVFNHVLEHITETLKKENKLTLIPSYKKNFKINFSLIPHSLQILNQINEVAEDNNAILLSTEYRGNLHKYKFYDNKTNKEFEITWKELKKKGYPDLSNKRVVKSKSIKL